MKFWYCLREGIDGLFRARLATVVSAVTIAGALFLMATFAVLTYNLVRVSDWLRSRIELEAFIDKSIGDDKLQLLQARLEQTAGVASVQYIDEQEAMRIFREQWGEEFLDLLDSNPLPTSFRITLEKSQQRSEPAQALAARIELYEGIDEVVYRRDLVATVERYLSLLLGLDLIFGAIVSLGSVFVVVNQIRLVAAAKRHIIETMQLVGATRALIRWPFMIQGLIQGAAGAGLTCLIFLLFYRYFLLDYLEIFEIPPFFLSAISICGLLFGLLAGYFGVRRFVE